MGRFDPLTGLAQWSFTGTDPATGELTDDPLAGLRAAINHPNVAQRITAPEALAMFTTGAAGALGLADEIGTIEPGRSADITLLDADPRGVPGARVVATCVRGDWVHVAVPELWRGAVSDA